MKLARVSLAVALAALAAAPAAHAKRPAAPQIRSVSPLQLEVGETLTIKGRGFRPGVGRNTVVFLSSRKRAKFVRDTGATSRTLKVVVPLTLGRFLEDAGGIERPTRFRLRVISHRAGRSFTTRRLSPVIEPAQRPEPIPGVPESGGDGGGTPTTPPAPSDCNGDGTPDSASSDDDGDLLSDAEEQQLGTNACKADTDGDGMWDHWEYQSAIDLNAHPGGSPPQPYPGERPYPNPLDGTDAAIDFDGDGLKAGEEHAMWASGAAGKAARPLELDYSDGDQNTGDAVAAPADPLDLNADGDLTDDEKDVDADGLGNWDELRGRAAESWWSARGLGYSYPHLFLQPSFIDSDSDGDGLVDGQDDQDHDDLSNAAEIAPPYAGPGYLPDGNRHPFDPCLPVASDTCPLHP
jgi:hypothetical protein